MGAGIVATLFLGPLGLFVLMLATSKKNAHSKTKQDKRQSDAAAKESQRLHVNEVRDHEKTRQHYDHGLIYIRDVLSWKKKRLILLFPEIREYIDKIRSGRVPSRSKRGGKIRGGKGR